MQAPPPNIEFGALPRQTKYGDGTFPRHEDAWPLIDRKVWKPVSLNRHVRSIYDQLDGMCTSNGACQTMMVERSFRGRLRNPELNAEYLYYLHSKWGDGSTLDENLRALIDSGVNARLVANDRRAANRMLEAIDLNADFDAVATALQRGHPCLVGVIWPGSTRRRGHAICVTELEKGVGEWHIRGPNSWGEDWGEQPDYTPEELRWLEAKGYRPLTGGFYTLTERECADFATFGCWAAGSST